MSADLPPEREVSHCCRRQQNFILCDMFTLACKTAFSDLSQTRIMSGCHISYFCFGPLMVHWLAGLNYNVDSWADIRLWCATLSHGVMASVFFFRNLFFVDADVCWCLTYFTERALCFKSCFIFKFWIWRMGLNIFSLFFCSHGVFQIHLKWKLCGCLLKVCLFKLGTFLLF